jgi:hypothetical protein
MISFQTPVVSTTAEGTATIDIFPAGKPAITPQGDDQGYTPGVTIGPPTKTAAPEFHYNNRPFVGGRPLTLQTENATAPGNIHIVADYNLLTFKRDDVVNLLAAMSDTATTRLNTERKTFHYDNSVAYKQPAQGSIVMIEVTPHVYTATITGETGAEAATEFSSKVGANAEILSVEGGGTSKAGSSTKNSGSWTIYYVTGGLDIVQKN